MKNKRLAIFLTIFVFFAIVIVLSSAVFSLGNVSIKYLSTTNVLTGQEQSVLESANFKYGESVFFSNKKEYIKNLEKSNPYIRVINIQTVFPNKLIVNAVERNETYVIKLDSNKYVKTDEFLKVLSISNVFQNTTANGIVIENSGLNSQSVQAGDFFEIQDDYLTQLFNCFREWDNSYVNLKSKIESIELNYNNDTDRLLINMRSGVQIIIRKSKTNLSDKLNLAFSFYDLDEHNGQPVDYTKSGIIEVFENETQIYASYRQVVE